MELYGKSLPAHFRRYCLHSEVAEELGWAWVGPGDVDCTEKHPLRYPEKHRVDHWSWLQKQTFADHVCRNKHSLCLSKIFSATCVPPHCAKLSNAEAAFSRALGDPVSNKFTRTSIPKILLNASTLSLQPATRAITTMASSTIPIPEFISSEKSTGTTPADTSFGLFSGSRAKWKRAFRASFLHLGFPGE